MTSMTSLSPSSTYLMTSMRRRRTMTLRRRRTTMNSSRTIQKMKRIRRLGGNSINKVGANSGVEKSVEAGFENT